MRRTRILCLSGSPQEHRLERDQVLQALHLDVQDVEVHALLAAALAGENKVLAAIDEYEVAIRLDSRQIDCYAALARLQIHVGRKDDARLVIGRLRDLDPHHSQLTELEKSLQP